jgi:hypothetical protein
MTFDLCYLGALVIAVTLFAVGRWVWKLTDPVHDDRPEMKL